MDYASSLGPIDPQVPDREEKFLVPALGYLDKVNEMIEKSRNGTISPAEFQILQNQDLAMLGFYEQSKKLSSGKFDADRAVVMGACGYGDDSSSS